MTDHERYMHRCIQLAKLAAGEVSPNPMVGAVLVYNDHIIGEGYHKRIGEAHAEVNCINSVHENRRHLIEKATLYVSLEPCAHFGRTPPCADLIVHHKIKKVVIGVGDPFTAVNGRGIEKLKAAGVEVVQDVLRDACLDLNRRFFTFHNQKRPYIILKWAQSADRKIGSGTGERLMISNEYNNRLVHKWRSEEDAILVGTNTALQDDPSLNVRSWKGRNPVRLVIDMQLRLPPGLHVFDRKQTTIVFNTMKHEKRDNLQYYQLSSDRNLVQQLQEACYELKIQSVLVEGGAAIFQSFIEYNAWDEARVITNTVLNAGTGLAAPLLPGVRELSKEDIHTDSITYFANNVILT